MVSDQENEHLPKIEMKRRESLGSLNERLQESARIRAMHVKRRWSASTASVRKTKTGREVWEGEWVVLKLIDFIIWLGLAFKISRTLFRINFKIKYCNHLKKSSLNKFLIVLLLL